MKFTQTTYILLFLIMFSTACNKPNVKNDLKTVEVKFFEEDFEQIKQKRKEALEIGVLLTSKKDYVVAGFKIDSQFVKSKIRLKGDWVDHLEHKNKWSFRVKIGKGETFNGMRKISLQHPATRNYIYEWVFHKMQEEMGLIAMRYNFVNFKIDVEGSQKDLGIFALEEAFDKRMVENNERRSGVILKFDEDALWQDRASASINKRVEKPFKDFYFNAPIVSFNKSKVKKDSVLLREFRNASALLDGYRKKQLPSLSVFDLDKMGRFMALVNLLGGEHAIIWHNVRFYYNPITELLEPIGFDAIGGNEIKYVVGNHVLESDSSFEPYHKKYLKIVQQDSFISYFLSKHEEEMNHYIDILNTEFVDVKFDLEIIRHNQEIIRKFLKESLISSKFDDENRIQKEQIVKLNSFEFIEIHEKNKEIVFLEGNWVLKKPLIIPKGYQVFGEPNFRLDISNGAEIISESPFFFIGTDQKPIEIYSSNNTGDGLLVKNSKEISFFENVIFSNLSNPKENNWAITGAVTFYKSTVELKNVSFNNNTSEDALNIFDAQFSINNCSFINTYSDAFDGDFVKGIVSNITFSEIGNDAIDISGSNIEIDNIFVSSAGDKCISAGEKSKIIGENIHLLNSELAVTSKDLSEVKFSKVIIDNCKVGFTAFQKKSEFDKAIIIATETEVKNTKLLHLVDKKSIVRINGKQMQGTINVIERLYGNEFGKSSK